MSSGASEWANERSGTPEQSEQCGASKWMNWANKRADKPMAQYSTYQFYSLLTQGGMGVAKTLTRCVGNQRGANMKEWVQTCRGFRWEKYVENRGSNYRNWLALFMKEEDSCGYYSKERGRGKTRKSSLMSEYSLNVDYVTVIQFLMARKGSRICPSFDHANVVIMTMGKRRWDLASNALIFAFVESRFSHPDIHCIIQYTVNQIFLYSTFQVSSFSLRNQTPFWLFHSAKMAVFALA